MFLCLPVCSSSRLLDPPSTGILAITLAEAVFWALGYPAALIYYKLVDNVWIDVFSKDGAIKAAGFSGRDL